MITELEDPDPSYLLTALPAEFTAVFTHFFTAELTTIGRDGAPLTWPIMPTILRHRGLFIVATSIGLAQKVHNIRRRSAVALLYSDPTGSGLRRPPAVRVQGRARAPDHIVTAAADVDPEVLAILIEQGRRLLRQQPSMKTYMGSRLARYLMDWYFMRLIITVRPVGVSWWPEGDFSRPPRCLEVGHVVPD